MYRHLAHWPAYLALAWTLIAPLNANGFLDRLITEAAKQAGERSGSLVMRLHALSAGPVDPHSAPRSGALSSRLPATSLRRWW
jgi:hypothetical protein